MGEAEYPHDVRVLHSRGKDAVNSPDGPSTRQKRSMHGVQSRPGAVGRTLHFGLKLCQRSVIYTVLRYRNCHLMRLQMLHIVVLVLLASMLALESSKQYSKE